MVTTKQGLHGNVVLTITDTRGNVILHETVKPEDVDTIIERNSK
jgi:hypothetical protein